MRFLGRVADLGDPVGERHQGEGLLHAEAGMLHPVQVVPAAAALGVAVELVADEAAVDGAQAEAHAVLPAAVHVVDGMRRVDGLLRELADELRGKKQRKVVDILEEIAHITMYFATTHGEKIAAEIGIAPDSWELDMDGVKAGFGISDDIDRLTYRDLQQRRETIRKRLEGRSLQ